MPKISREAVNFWRRVDYAIKHGTHIKSGLPVFDYVMGKQYRKSNIPYMVHREGGVYAIKPDRTEHFVMK